MSLLKSVAHIESNVMLCFQMIGNNLDLFVELNDSTRVIFYEKLDMTPTRSFSEEQAKLC